MVAIGQLMTRHSLNISFEANTGMHPNILSIGTEGNPVLQIDNFLQEADATVANAAQLAPFTPVSTDLYPGVRKTIDTSYITSTLECLTPLMRDCFGLQPSSLIKPSFAAFSLTTQAPEGLLPIQRIPHFDTSSPDQFALVIYLFKGAYGGTSFYRHRSTGFESISTDRARPYAHALEQEARSHGLPAPAYINGDTDLFTRIHQIEPRFNRALIYRSNLLHAGNVGAQLSTDPTKGRLTFNSFLSISKS